MTWHRTTLARAFFAEAGAEGNASTAAANALRRYFAGELEAPDSIAVATSATELQEKAWAALRGIPAGQTTTYSALGKSVGLNDWRAAVDIGAAVGANPIAIIVPCHRVLGASGDLKGCSANSDCSSMRHTSAVAPKAST